MCHCCSSAAKSKVSLPTSFREFLGVAGKGGETGPRRETSKCRLRIEKQAFVGRDILARRQAGDRPSFELVAMRTTSASFTHDQANPASRDPSQYPITPRARANLLLSPSAVLNMDFVDRFEKRTLWGAGKNLSAKWGSTTVIMRGRPAGM